MKIEKSKGQTRTEKTLAELCDRTFLKLWSYPNPFKNDGNELCDLLAIFENHIFIFFDRESKIFNNKKKNEYLKIWERWKREVIDKQIHTATGAEKYIKRKSDIYLDAKCKLKYPINIPDDKIIIHKIIVAHGATEACKEWSKENIYGSLAISYSEPTNDSWPFMIHLDKNNIAHVFDGFNLEIILNELDTVYDFTSFLETKEKAIKSYDTLTYCGEEDLLAHYYSNFDETTRKYCIGIKDDKFNGLCIGEGEWMDFIKTEPYKRKKAADKISYLWDGLMQYTSQNVLDGNIIGDIDVFNDQNPLKEMAKEPRVVRRVLSNTIKNAIDNFPRELKPRARQLTFFESKDYNKGYVFLQFRDDETSNYENEYRSMRKYMLKIACGTAKNKFPHLKKIVGIATDPIFAQKHSEDIMLLDCEQWNEDNKKYYEEENKIFRFFERQSKKMGQIKTIEFPLTENFIEFKKIGRNKKCPCGSGRKYKKCCGKQFEPH